MLEQMGVDYREILTDSKTIAVVGLSPKEVRPSNQVARYLIEHGYQVIPVNPGHDSILSMTCYPDLESIPVAVDIVDIFRNPKDVPPVVDSAIKIGAKIIWMQLGIIHDQAALKAQSAGLTVVMDRCIKVDHQTLGVGG